MQDKTDLLKAIVRAKPNFGQITKDKTAEVFSKRTGKAHRYSYTDISSITEAIEPALLDQGVLIVHELIPQEGGDFRLQTVLVHAETGQQICNNFPVGHGDPQSMGSGITYARRYNLVSLLNLNVEDDDGASATSARKNTTKAVEPSTQVSPVKAIVADIVKVTGFDPGTLKAIAKANGLPEKSGDMSEAHAKEFQRACLCNWLCQRYIGMAPDTAAQLIDEATPSGGPLVIAEVLANRLADWQPPGGLAREKPTMAGGLSIE